MEPIKELTVIEGEQYGTPPDVLILYEVGDEWLMRDNPNFHLLLAKSQSAGFVKKIISASNLSLWDKVKLILTR